MEQDPQNRRFWIAEAASPIISRSGRDMDCHIYYFTATNEEYTCFTVEGGHRTKVAVKYSMCLDRVTAINARNNTVNITEMERDRLTKLGKALDNGEMVSRV